MESSSKILTELAERIASLQLLTSVEPSFNRPYVQIMDHDPFTFEHETFQAWDKDFQFFHQTVRRNQMIHSMKPTHDKVPDEENLFDVKELLNELKPRRPPKSYICNICYKTGHYIQYCPKAPDNTLTPYQGSKRCFGEFICSKCKRRWKSSKSFAEIGQECKKCKITVFPKKQYALAHQTQQKGNNENGSDSMSTSVSSTCSSFNSC